MGDGVVGEEEVVAATVEEGCGCFLTWFSMLLATIVFAFIWYCNRESEKKKNNNVATQQQLATQHRQEQQQQEEKKKKETPTTTTTTTEATIKTESTIEREVVITAKTETEPKKEPCDLRSNTVIDGSKVEEVKEDVSTEDVSTPVQHIDDQFLDKLDNNDTANDQVAEQSTVIVTNVEPKTTETRGETTADDSSKVAAADVEDFVVVNDATVAEPQPTVDLSGTTTYEIDVKTGDKSGAGTDANVFIIIYGEGKNTGKINLCNSDSNKHKFEKNQTDRFVEEAAKVGKIQKIRIGHDNHGGFAGWYLDSVVVNVPALNCKWTCPADRWLDKKEWDGQIECDVYPTLIEETYVDVVYEHVQADGSVSVSGGEKIVSDDGKQIIVEQVTTTTTSEELSKHVNVPSGETSVPSAEEIKLPVDDEEIVACEEVPEVQSGIDLEDLVMPEVVTEVESTPPGMLEEEEEMISCDVVTEVESTPPGIFEEELISCEVEAEVESCPPDALDVVEVAEHAGESDAVLQANADLLVKSVIENVSATFHEDFKVVGRGIPVAHGYRLATVEDVNKSLEGVSRALSATSHDAVDVLGGAVVKCDDDAYETTAPMFVENEYILIVREDVTSSVVVMTCYDIDVKTGSKSGAGTDANVFIILSGDKATTDKIILKDSKTNKNAFEKKHTDSFTIECVDVGVIDKITIGHDNKGGFAGWYLDDVTIGNEKMAEKLKFVADRWLDLKEDDGKLEVELLPINPPKVATTEEFVDLTPPSVDLTPPSVDLTPPSVDANVNVTVEEEKKEKKNKEKDGESEDSSDDDVSEEEAMKLFQQFDIDGDGRITVEEFMKKLKKEKKKKKKEKKRLKKEKKRLLLEAEAAGSTPSTTESEETSHDNA